MLPLRCRNSWAVPEVADAFFKVPLNVPSVSSLSDHSLFHPWAPIRMALGLGFMVGRRLDSQRDKGASALCGVALLRRRSGVQFPPAALLLAGAREFTTPRPPGPTRDSRRRTSRRQ